MPASATTSARGAATAKPSSRQPRPKPKDLHHVRPGAPQSARRSASKSAFLRTLTPAGRSSPNGFDAVSPKTPPKAVAASETADAQRGGGAAEPPVSASAAGLR